MEYLAEMLGAGLLSASSSWTQETCIPVEAPAGQSAISEPWRRSLLPEFQGWATTTAWRQFRVLPDVGIFSPVMSCFSQQVYGPESAQTGPALTELRGNSGCTTRAGGTGAEGRNVLRNLAASTAANRQLDQFFIYINYLIIWVLSRQFSLIFHL